jgi:hypothetical protein
VEVNVFFSPRYMKRWKEEGGKGYIFFWKSQIASYLSYHIKSVIVSLLAVIQCCLIGFHIESFKKVSALSFLCNSFKFFVVNEKGDLL